MNNIPFVLTIIFVCSLVAALAIGWVMNIMTLLHMAGGVTAEMVVRIVGIFIAPVGAVAGWF